MYITGIESSYTGKYSFIIAVCFNVWPSLIFFVEIYTDRLVHECKVFFVKSLVQSTSTVESFLLMGTMLMDCENVAGL